VELQESITETLFKLCLTSVPLVSIFHSLTFLKGKMHQFIINRYTVKKRLAIFPSPAGMSLTKRALAGNNLIIRGQGECVV